MLHATLKYLSLTVIQVRKNGRPKVVMDGLFPISKEVVVLYIFQILMDISSNLISGNTFQKMLSCVRSVRAPGKYNVDFPKSIIFRVIYWLRKKWE